MQYNIFIEALEVLMRCNLSLETKTKHNTVFK